MTTEFASVPSSITVQQTLDYLRQVEGTRETVYAIYVLDPVTKNLVQAITLRRLITGDPGAPVLSVARPGRLITVSPLMDEPPLTVAVKLTAWPELEGFGPLSAKVVVVVWPFTTWFRIDDVLLANIALPPYTAVIGWLPTDSEFVENVAVAPVKLRASTVFR